MKKLLWLIAIGLFVNINCSFAANLSIDKTIETYSAQISENPNAAQAYSNRGSLRFLKKDIKGALSDFDKAIQISPNDPKLYLNRGYIKQVINNLEDAANDYNQALKINPNFAFAYNNRGVLKVAQNDINGAIEDYAKALQLNPKYSDVYYNRGNLKFMLNDNEGALADYNKAIELNPKDSEAYNNRGVVKKRMNFNVGALSDYSQAIAINPKDSIAYANRGRLKKLYFDNEGAAIDLDQAIALAENQTFIKNVKPLVSRESYIAAIPVVDGLTPDITPIIKIDGTPVAKAETIVKDYVAHTPSEPTKKMTSSKPVEQVNKVSEKIAVSTKTSETAIKPVKVEEKATANDIKPTIAKTEIENGEKIASAGVISAGIGTVQKPYSPMNATKQVTEMPTTNKKLAESYYIRGLQKCVLKDLQGAIADLNKAIDNDLNYADAYYYRAAIRKELGDKEGFRNDYSKAIQLNPSLQTFNNEDCLSLIR